LHIDSCSTAIYSCLNTTPSNTNNQTFAFANGAAFHPNLNNIPVNLTFFNSSTVFDLQVPGTVPPRRATGTTRFGLGPRRFPSSPSSHGIFNGFEQCLGLVLIRCHQALGGPGNRSDGHRQGRAESELGRGSASSVAAPAPDSPTTRSMVRDHRVAIRGRRRVWRSMSLSSRIFLWTPSHISAIKQPLV
jgi:hypothetical protein